MKSRDFCYWLQGFFELAGSGTAGNGTPVEKDVLVSKGQIAVIKRHLNMVFKHEIDPDFGPVEHQEALSEIHSPGESVGLFTKPNC
jgi:hypothetical protein